MMTKRIRGVPFISMRKICRSSLLFNCVNPIQPDARASTRRWLVVQGLSFVQKRGPGCNKLQHSSLGEKQPLNLLALNHWVPWQALEVLTPSNATSPVPSHPHFHCAVLVVSLPVKRRGRVPSITFLGGGAFKLLLPLISQVRLVTIHQSHPDH